MTTHKLAKVVLPSTVSQPPFDWTHCSLPLDKQLLRNEPDTQVVAKNRGMEENTHNFSTSTSLVPSYYPIVLLARSPSVLEADDDTTNMVFGKRDQIIVGMFMSDTKD